jgi:hypothetical protein
MKLLVVGDVHTRYEKVERIISKYKKTHKFVFVGDYFDQFGDTPESNASTAHWLKTTMNEHPDWVFLRGNHDEMYDPRVNVMCSGFSSAKKTAINEVLTIEDWDKLKYFHFENKCWFSHAGITKYWFGQPMNERITPERVQSVIDDAVIKQRSTYTENAIWASSSRRGGNSVVGSILWQDWRDLELIPDFKQVVGHTPIPNIQAITDNLINSTIINVDCSTQTYHANVLEIEENGAHNLLNTSYV